MMQPSNLLISLFDSALLRTASLLVPAALRQDWRQEWSSELWHVRRACVSCDQTFSWQAQREITAFCLGAFPDALCLRTQPAKTRSASVHIHGSAAHTLLCLASTLALCFAISRLLPGVDAEDQAARYQVSPGVLMIDEAADSIHRGISSSLYRNWKATPQRFFEELAFYRVSRETIDAGRRPMSWHVAHATTNLFSLLGLPVNYQANTADANQPGTALSDATVVLSYEIWMRSFSADPHVSGRFLRIGNRSVRIVGVASALAWQPPGAPDVWLLESDAQIASSASTGYLFAHLSERGQAMISGPNAAITARNPEGFAIDLVGTPINAPVEGPWGIYKFAIFLALVALPAVISVSLGDSHVSAHRPSLQQQCSRSLFLGAKFVLVAAIGFAASLDLAYSNTIGYSSFAECLQLLSCFTICLFGFRWAVADQRKRCPICLRRVTNPATVGLASRTFLGWNGTEMICMDGHALLHVPSLPTSWFSGQRWLYLDSSWDFLFSDSCVS